jgi:L-amino acid N-acyltransferase YncA
MTITNLLPEHWPAVKAIYEAGLATGNASFQTQAPDWDEWNAGHLAQCRMVALVGERVIGWVALSQVSSRWVYSGVAEVSIYIDANYRGQCVGTALLQELVTESEVKGIWMLQAGIFPENIASIRLHERAGFREVGYREKIGKMGDRWRDTVLLERRSLVVGV